MPRSEITTNPGIFTKLIDALGEWWSLQGDKGSLYKKLGRFGQLYGAYSLLALLATCTAWIPFERQSLKSEIEHLRMEASNIVTLHKIEIAKHQLKIFRLEGLIEIHKARIELIQNSTRGAIDIHISKDVTPNSKIPTVANTN